jgi:DNA-binding protein HU-beta
LAYALAEQHQFTKKQGQEMLAGLVGMITKHLKKGERVKIAGLGILQARESGCPHGPQSHDRRADPDQGE